jgi:MoxR-like ATPase
MQELTYRGDGLPPDGDPARRYPYLADSRLATVVNMAMALGRPLLVQGPPGCGKTELAASISHELGLKLHRWHVKSTSHARDGLYQIDVLRRLQDAQSNNPKAQSLIPYLRFGPLGEALRSVERSVVLIDEIDKADIDFPNDLLRELDKMEFSIDELDEDDALRHGMQKVYRAAASPMVVVTSNDEKELPDAFLRRCLYHYIEFPSPERLCTIVGVNTAHLGVDTALVEVAVRCFERLRAAGDFRKEPATSELIDWIVILHRWGVGVAALENRTRLTELPYWDLLFKHQADLKTLERVDQGTASL